jgi:putative transposase
MIPGTKGFLLLPKRWVVERTFGWFNRYRCLSKDYELLTQTSEAMIRVVMIQREHSSFFRRRLL